MRGRGSSVEVRPSRLAASALAAALLAGSAGGSYLKWRKDRSEGLAELKKQPSLVLEREVLPEDCFILSGGPEYAAGPRPQLLAAAFDHSSPAHELVGSREIIPERGLYGILLPAGSYELLYFADLDGDGLLDATFGGAGAKK